MINITLQILKEIALTTNDLRLKADLNKIDRYIERHGLYGIMISIADNQVNVYRDNILLLRIEINDEVFREVV